MNINFITIAAILIFFIGSVQVYAQKDTVFTKISTEYGTLEQQEMATEADRLFGNSVPAKWVVKFARDLTTQGFGNFGTEFNNYNGVGVEFKIKPSMSLGINYFNDRALLDFTNTQYAHFFQIEERWYYKMAKRNAQGKGANNMTGRYLGLQQNIVINQQVPGFSNPPRTEYGLSARYGIQSRFKKHGFFDFSAGLGYRYAPSKTGFDVQRFTLNQSFRIGLGIFDNSKVANFSGNYCRVLRCFDEKKRMWKINFLGIVQASSSYGVSFSNNYASITPNIAFEQKLGDKPFSVEVSTDLTLLGWRYKQFGSSSNSRLEGKTLSNLVNLEFRWYYNQNRRIAKGKQDNTLIGPFMALQTDYNYTLAYQNTNTQNIRSRGDDISYNLLWGYQLRIFKHGYAQFRIGAGILHQNSFNNLYDDIYRDRSLLVLSDLKVGYTF
jgi:hypothetical protein